MQTSYETVKFMYDPFISGFVIVDSLDKVPDAYKGTIYQSDFAIYTKKKLTKDQIKRSVCKKFIKFVVRTLDIQKCATFIVDYSVKSLVDENSQKKIEDYIPSYFILKNDFLENQKKKSVAKAAVKKSDKKSNKRKLEKDESKPIAPQQPVKSDLKLKPKPTLTLPTENPIMDDAKVDEFVNSCIAICDFIHDPEIEHIDGLFSGKQSSVLY